MKVPDPPGSGKGAANGKGIIVRWGLKRVRDKPYPCSAHYLKVLHTNILIQEVSFALHGQLLFLTSTTRSL